ncbi:AraC family transcriptional regulator [Caballeronia humi]|uniref:AraC family transcriptional regulator n=1 Tax=Caballeronia humi TaxID=326474 RepID=A0A158G259_9BURK|nr:AraC family transcriptional regulator [Caballeronia humi]SAL26165.1 AraC family transcriptional regulator [Caballeronia humi]
MRATPQPSTQRRINGFSAVSGAPGLEYCISGGTPYTFEVADAPDMICLLLGTIVSETRYDDGPALPFTFQAETAAFHARGGSMRIEAQQVRNGFIAFRYLDAFQRHASATRRMDSRSNLGADAIRHLVRYARLKVPADSALRVDPWEMQCLATLAWIETTRHLETTADKRTRGISDAEFSRLEQYVTANIEERLSCAEIAATLDLPVRVVFEGVKARTGYSLYRFVLEKRIDAATQLLRATDTPLCDVAAACGFSSQQHMTALFSARIGTTPLRLRKNAQ